METKSRQWEEIGKLLRDAKELLGHEPLSDRSVSAPAGPLTGTVREFEEFLDHNELELAWNALAAVAERVKAPRSCWNKLRSAARLMQLPAQQALAERHEQ